MNFAARCFLFAILCGPLLSACNDDPKLPGTGGTSTSNGSSTSSGMGGAGGESSGGNGGMGGGSTGGGGQGNPAPAGFAVIFPPPDCITDESTLTVRGVADASTTKSVTVAGILAQTNDGFASWKVQLPLALGSQTLDVDLVDNGGATISDVALLSVQRADLLMREPQRIALDTAGGRVFVWDLGLVEVSLTAGKRKTIPTNGVLFGAVAGIAWNATTQRLLVLGNDKLAAVDPVLGMATIIADGAKGSGPFPSDASDMALDAANGRVFVVHDSAVTAIDLATGNRTLVSDASQGMGPALSQTRSMAIDTSGGRVFVGTASNGVIAVDLATGNRTALANANGAYLISLVYDANGKRLFAGTLGSGLVQIDTIAGTTAVVADLKKGTGPAPMRTEGIAFDGTNIVAADRYLDGVISVQTTTGDRTTISGYFAGSGMRPLVARKGVWDQFGRRLLTMQTSFDPAVLSIAPNGTRTVLASATVGSGAMFFTAPWDIDVVDDKAFLANSGDVVHLDLATGTRAMITGFNKGTGPMLTAVNGLAIDANGQQVWLRQNPGTIFGVDVATGNRKLVADDVTGSGPPLGFITDIVYNNPRMLVLTTSAVLDLDLATGDRVVVSSAQVGSGPMFIGGSDGVINGQGLLYMLQSTEVMTVDLATGARQLLPKPGTGELTKTPFDGLAFGTYGVLYTYGQFINGMIAIDAVTGERVIFAK